MTYKGINFVNKSIFEKEGYLVASSRYDSIELPRLVPDIIDHSYGPLSEIYIKTNGTMWACGYNGPWGKLGIGTAGDYTERYSSPIQVGTLSTWEKITVSWGASFAIKTNGTLWSWGDNEYGSLCHGDTVHRSSPTQVGSLSTWSRVWNEFGNFIATKTNGTLWVCGDNSDGKLGLGNTINRSSPVQVGALSDWSQISGSGGKVVAIKTTGTLWTWGKNDGYNNLGLGDTINRSSPTQVGTLSNWSAIGLNGDFTIMLKSTGTLWFCGYAFNNVFYSENKSSPVQVGTSSDWSQIYVTNINSILGIKTNGTLWRIGEDPIFYGEVTDNNGVQTGTLSDWGSFKGSHSNTLIKKTNNTFWNYDFDGVFHPINDKEGNITALLSRKYNTSNINISDMYRLQESSFLIFEDTRILVGGVNSYGQLGLGHTSFVTTPVQLGEINEWKFGYFSSQFLMSVFLKMNGTLWTCGYNNFGQLGLGDNLARSSPVQVGTLSDWSKIGETYVTRTDNSVWVWGWNIDGKLGLGDTIDRLSPVQLGIKNEWDKIVSNGRMSVLLKTNGNLWTCGYNNFGQLGLGDTIHRSSPVQVGTLSDWSKISGAGVSIFALKTNNTLWACGYNYNGHLGLGDTIHRSSPTQVGTLSDWYDTYGNYAVKTDGTLWCINNSLVSSPIQVGKSFNWVKPISTGTIWGQYIGLAK